MRLRRFGGLAAATLLSAGGFGALQTASVAAPLTHATGAITALGARGNVLHLTLPAGKALLGSSGSSNLQYNGGLVEQAGTTNYAIFWEPPGSSVSSTYNSLIQRFFGDIGGSSVYGVATQYYQTVNGATTNIVNSSSLGAAWVDTQAYPAPVLTDADIQNEVLHAMAVNHWSGGVGHEFFVFTAPGETSCSLPFCSETYFCAYHSNFSSGGSDILYADQPYPSGTPVTSCSTPTSPNGDPAADSTINVVSHELMETVTDPNGDAWLDSSGNEIGDKCNFTFGPTAANGSDITLNGHPYMVQEEWSNAKTACSMS